MEDGKYACCPESWAGAPVTQGLLTPVMAGLLERNPRLASWIWGFKPPERGTIVLVHRRVYILPARLGLLYGGTLAILLIGSIN